MRAPVPDLRLVVAAMTGWAVCAVTLGVSPGWRFALAAAAGLVAVVLLAGGRPVVALMLVAAATCAATSAVHSLVREAGPLRTLAEQGATVRLEARVAGDPRTVARHGPAPGQLVLVPLAVSTVEGRGRRSSVTSTVLVFGDDGWAGLRWGEQVRVLGRLAPARPGDDVVATLTARGPPQVLGPAGAVARGAERLREGLRASARGLPEDPRGLLPGLVVGDTSMQPADLGQAMRDTGLTHLAAVSGTNVTIVCLLVLWAARSVGLGWRTRLLVAACSIAGFVVLARPEPSVLRAAVMGAVGLVALADMRTRAGLPALAAAVLVLLQVDPWLARSYGFALSVLATLGLLLFAAPWAERLSRYLPRPLAVAVAVPLAAQVMCGPVLVLLSGQVSLVSVPANMLADPLVAPATVLGLAATLVAPWWPPLGVALAWLGGLPCLLIAQVARHGAALPGGQLDWPGGARGAAALAALTVALLVVGPTAARWGRRHPWATGACLLVLFVGCGPLPGTGSWPPDGLVVVACDVGQGDALVLPTGPGRAVLVDAGPDPDAVDRCLRRLRIRTLDLVVLTHFHADHVEGLPGALRGREVRRVLVTIVDDPPAEARRVLGWAARAGARVERAEIGQDETIGPVRWRVLWPARVIRDGSVPNNASIVLRVDVRPEGRGRPVGTEPGGRPVGTGGGVPQAAAGGAGEGPDAVRLLLLGDVEPAAARQVARRLEELGDGPRVDVLKVAHHGSALQDPGLLADASARLALISVGADNDYGHPTPSTLRLLASVGAEVERTDQRGDIAVVRRAGRLGVVTAR